MTDDILIDTTEINKRKKVAVVSALLLLAAGMFLFITYRNFLDMGHIPLAVGYLILVIAVYVSLNKARIIPALLCLALAGGVLFLSLVKVQWSKDYLKSLTTRQAFILEDYIERYPTFEEYYFAGFLGVPDWVRFSRDCVEKALNKQPVAQNCRTADSIRDAYNIDIQKEINHFMGRMQSTAIKVKDGGITSGQQYQSCIAQRNCAPIPLLPENVDAEKISVRSKEYAEVRRAFWDLVEKKGLTKDICLSMLLCKAMNITGAVAFQDKTSAALPDSPSQGLPE